MGKKKTFLDECKNDNGCDIIGMLHIPSNSILTAPLEWRERLGLPMVTKDDWEIIKQFETLSISKYPDQYYSDYNYFNPSISIHGSVYSLSFYEYLLERMLEEAQIYHDCGIEMMMIENVGAPYFMRNSIPVVEKYLLNCLAMRLRDAYPDKQLGIQILSSVDNIALDIAISQSFDFIRGESFLFSGYRPEGPIPNYGNLAQAYMYRNYRCGNGKYPKILVDIKKKHTVFLGELNADEAWIDNIGFQKLEGLIITSDATGKPINELDLRNIKELFSQINRTYREKYNISLGVPLIAGAGATYDNIGIYKMYVNAVIVGSNFKTDGYWENRVERGRVERFMNEYEKKH